MLNLFYRFKTTTEGLKDAEPFSPITELIFFLVRL
jgi:hypothetical protein